MDEKRKERVEHAQKVINAVFRKYEPRDVSARDMYEAVVMQSKVSENDYRLARERMGVKSAYRDKNNHHWYRNILKPADAPNDDPEALRPLSEEELLTREIRKVLNRLEPMSWPLVKRAVTKAVSEYKEAKL